MALVAPLAIVPTPRSPLRLRTTLLRTTHPNDFSRSHLAVLCLLVRSCVICFNSPCPKHQVMEYPAHDLPVTGLGFAPREAGVALGGYDLLAGSADYKITLFKSQGEGGGTVRVSLCVRCVCSAMCNAI